VSDDTPFLVISDGSTQNAQTFLQEAKSQGHITGFMTALSIMQGISSALQHLHTEHRMGKRQLEICLQVRDFPVLSSGNVIIGYDLFTADTSIIEEVSAADLDQWLKEAFWRLTNKLFFGDENFVVYEDWNSICQATSHIFPLLAFVAFDCPDFTFLVERLSLLRDRLIKMPNLVWKEIRRCMLEAERIDPCHFYYPPTPLDVSIGDVGYMRNGAFVKLCSIWDDRFLITSGSAPEYTRSSGTGAAFSRPIEDAVTLHTFTDPLYVEIYRPGAAQDVGDPVKLFKYFMEQIPTLMEIYGQRHDIKVTDVILISGLWTDRRMAGAEFLLKDGGPSPPRFVKFVEYHNARPEESWGKWIIEGQEYTHEPNGPKDRWITMDSGHRVRLQFMRRLQRIHYLQLHQDDV